VVFADALEREGLLARVTARQDGLVDPTTDDPARPVLLALSDNAPADDLGLHPGVHGLVRDPPAFRPPGTPTDQAWIESLFGHVKAKWPHLSTIRDPAVLRAELAVVRERYNGVRLHAGYVSIGTSFGSWLGHMLLPWVVLALLNAAVYARMTRGNLIETMAQDYIRTARVKGLPEWKVIYKHGLRSSLTPVITMFGMDLGTLFGGAVITETVFKLQGMGQWVVSSVFNGDFPAILAVTVVTSLAITVMNLFVDIVYAYLDPRVRYT
jgi:ABC-type dipeptide/oligopeptide/nickel transport system permease component